MTPSVLSSDQQRGWAVLESGASAFVTGDAGTGKTYLLHSWIEHARAQGRVVDVTAATGVAASLHDRGMSLHAWAGIPLQGEWREALEQRRWHKVARPRMASADVVVIDECSMLSARTLDAAEQLCRLARARSTATDALSRPWGGLQVVLVGDPGQLPPVDEHNGWPWESGAWRALQPVPVVLREVLRQSGDPAFARMLAELRRGRASGEHFERLERALGEPDPEAPRLLCRRAAVQEANARALQALAEDREIYTILAEDTGSRPVPEDCPAPLSVELAIGARVMVTRNLYTPTPPCPGERTCTALDCQHPKHVDVPNGALGRLTAWDPAAAGGTATVLLDSGRSLSLTRVEWDRTERALPARALQPGGPPAACPCGQPAVHDAGPTHGLACDACLGRLARQHGKREVLWCRAQLPLALAWAITVHKSQGQSYDRCSVDLGSVFAPGQGYVAVSRARSLQGLTVECLTGQPFRCHQRVLDFECSGYRADPGLLQPLDESDLRARDGGGMARIPCALEPTGKRNSKTGNCELRATCSECGHTETGWSAPQCFARMREHCPNPLTDKGRPRARWYYDQEGEE